MLPIIGLNETRMGLHFRLLRKSMSLWIFFYRKRGEWVLALKLTEIVMVIEEQFLTKSILPLTSYSHSLPDIIWLMIPENTRIYQEQQTPHLTFTQTVHTFWSGAALVAPRLLRRVLLRPASSRSRFASARVVGRIKVARDRTMTGPVWQPGYRSRWRVTDRLPFCWSL